MRRQISNDTWEQIKTVYASGIGLRELARNMDIPSGTVLARAKRDRWTQQIQCAKTQLRVVQSNAITPMQERGQRYTERMARVSERLLPHLESLPPGDILERARNVEQFDRFSRRNFGLDSQPPGGSPVNLAILTNQAAIQIASPESQRPRTA